MILTLPEEIKKILQTQNDKITLGSIIKALLFLSNKVPSEGGPLIKLIQEANTSQNLGIWFVTDNEKQKLASFDITGIPAGSPPILLAQILSLATEFDDIKNNLKGDPGVPNDKGLIGDFFETQIKVNNIGYEITNILSNPVIKGEKFTKNEKSKISAISFIKWDANTKSYLPFTDIDFANKVKYIMAESGSDNQRPGAPNIGEVFFDVTLGKPIWAKNDNPVEWVDATGTIV